MAKKPTMRTHNGGDYEQIVMAEVLIPDTPNTEGDIFTREAVRGFAHQFMMTGLNAKVGNDIEHDNVDVTGKVYVVESFIAREGDPHFIEGSWVIAMWINDDEIWQRILDNDLNGFSFESLVGMTPVIVENLRPRIITGITAPDLIDGHTHTYLITVDAVNKPTKGMTGETDGHWHNITRHTITDATNGHTHRFNVLQQENIDV